jgi:hypothetical protein
MLKAVAPPPHGEYRSMSIGIGTGGQAGPLSL